MSAFDPKWTLRQIAPFQCAGLSNSPAVVLSLEADDEAARVHHASRRCGGYVGARWAHATAIREYRIGYLGVASHAGYAREIEALLKGLHQLGYEEGKNIAIHYQFAEGDYNRLPALPAELVALKVDVLLTHSTPGARAARQTTPTVPIVVMAAADFVSSGLVPSIARPGGNL